MSNENEIPAVVAEVLRDEEIENIRNRNGWAIGTVVHEANGYAVNRIEGAIIELFNGEGQAGEFGGVRFLAEHDGEYEEAYAYATGEAYDHRGRESGWYVEEYTNPTDPDVGKEAP